MAVTSKTSPDPVASMQTTDAYMRWALLAAEEVAGKNGLTAILRESRLDRFINNYPSEILEANSNITFGDYANFNAALLNFFGRAAKSMTIRIGRASAKHGIEKQGALFGLGALVASKLLPLPSQVKIGAEAQISGFKKLSEAIGETFVGRVEDRGDKLALMVETCAICAGITADSAICHSYTGTLHESTKWLTGKELEIVEVECRAMGAPACVWEISKTPKA